MYSVGYSYLSCEIILITIRNIVSPYCNATPKEFLIAKMANDVKSGLFKENIELSQIGILIYIALYSSMISDEWKVKDTHSDR